MEVRRPAAIQQIHSSIGNLLICVHVAIVFLITVDELKHSIFRVFKLWVPSFFRDAPVAPLNQHIALDMLIRVVLNGGKGLLIKQEVLHECVNKKCSVELG